MLQTIFAQFILVQALGTCLAGRQLLLNSSLSTVIIGLFPCRLWTFEVYKWQAGWRPIAVSFQLYIMCCTYAITYLSSVNCLFDVDKLTSFCWNSVCPCPLLSLYIDIDYSIQRWVRPRFWTIHFKQCLHCRHCRCLFVVIVHIIFQ